MSGAGGLIGSALSERLRASGREVVGLSRSPHAGDLGWNPKAGRLDVPALEGFDAVVHLAGESIANGRWTAVKKAEILTTRVRGTDLLACSLAKVQRKPSTLIVASAVGYYGHRPDEVLTEDSASGGGFLAEVCRQWEAAAEPARQAGIRVVHPRFGMVLSAKGGALAPLLVVTKLGLGGPIGSGRQLWSWVALDDLVGAITYALEHTDITGPMNVVAPNPVPQRQFAATLGRVLYRPGFMPLPAFAARIVLGQMADELLLADQNVRPAKLLASGYQFAHSDLELALRSML
jgi:uncharacterized protein